MIKSCQTWLIIHHSTVVLLYVRAAGDAPWITNGSSIARAIVDSSGAYRTYLTTSDSSAAATVMRPPSSQSTCTSCVLAVENARPVHAFLISQDLCPRPPRTPTKKKRRANNNNNNK